MTASRTLAILVATHRPRTLTRLLDALLALELPHGCSIEVRVVDNDPAGAAAAIVDAFGARAAASIGVRYAREPRPGVAAVRNAALALGPADLVAFIDDDEWPTPRWLVELVDVLDASGADAVVGPVVAALPNDGPAWTRPRFRGAPCAAAGPVPWVVGRTGNALLRGSWFYARGFRFDDSFGLSGGEDADLFSRLDEAGARFVASSAVVYEDCDAGRLSLSWLLARQQQQGMNYERIKSRRHDAHAAPLRAAGHVAKLAVLATRTAATQLWRRRFDDEGVLEVVLGGAWVTGLVRQQLRLRGRTPYARGGA